MPGTTGRALLHRVSSRAPPITVGLIADALHEKRAGGQLRLGPAPSAGS